MYGIPDSVKPLSAAEEQVMLAVWACRAPVTRRDIDAKLRAKGFRVEVDHRSEKLGYKIREGRNERIPYLLIVGDKDLENNTVSPRHRAEGDLGAMSYEEFEALLTEVVATKAKK